MIKSTSKDQDKILLNILSLIGEERFTLDPCYGKGNFYKNVPEPLYKIDINGQNAPEGDSRKLPFPDNSIKSIIFDPPFLATTRPSLKKDTGNIINKQFSVYPSEKELFEFYCDSLLEFYRLITQKGWLIIKCQDKVSSGKQYFSHIYIHNMALSLGFYPKDLFIYIKNNRIVADWQKNQQHARKFHSYFWIFQKIKPKVTGIIGYN